MNDQNQSPLVNTSNAKRPEDTSGYDAVIAKIAEDKVCPFCEEHLRTYHKNPIVAENTHWLLTKNMYPYANTRVHLLIVCRTHITHVSELTPGMWQNLLDILSTANTMYNIEGGSFFMRFGNTRYTGASVNHLHAQLLTSDPDNPEYKPVLARLG